MSYETDDVKFVVFFLALKHHIYIAVESSAYNRNTVHAPNTSNAYATLLLCRELSSIIEKIMLG
jgi:hypothetical protein